MYATPIFEHRYPLFMEMFEGFRVFIRVFWSDGPRHDRIIATNIVCFRAGRANRTLDKIACPRRHILAVCLVQRSREVAEFIL